MLNILPEDMDPEFNANYPLDDPDSANLFNQNNKMLLDANLRKNNNRDPREEAKEEPKITQSKKKNLSDLKYGIYDPKNIKMARNRLFHDLNNQPTDILKETFFKNRENQLKKSRFEQRDITSHLDKRLEKAAVDKIIEEERKRMENVSYNLWDVESEKELQDKESGYWRGKRESTYFFNAVRKISSVGNWFYFLKC